MQREVQQIDPLTDPRWPVFLERHPDASVFHTREWMTALQRTYGYEPVVYTTSKPNEQLENGIPFCRVKSWLTGKRLVSLPFSDHCQPLVNSGEAMMELLNAVEQDRSMQGMKYAEIRPMHLVSDDCGAFGVDNRFWFHRIDLSGDVEAIYGRFHKTSVRQMIKRAEREGVSAQIGNSGKHLTMFYDLLVMTRRKHLVPPQPIAWFRNLLDCLGPNCRVGVALRDRLPIASVMTLSFRSTDYYKYGCSDSAYTTLGGTHFLLWEAIRSAKERGALGFDMGRTDQHNEGLAVFKERYGAQRSELTYMRHPARTIVQNPGMNNSGIRQMVFRNSPDALLRLAGNLMYKHVG